MGLEEQFAVTGLNRGQLQSARVPLTPHLSKHIAAPNAQDKRCIQPSSANDELQLHSTTSTPVSQPFLPSSPTSRVPSARTHAPPPSTIMADAEFNALFEEFLEAIQGYSASTRQALHELLADRMTGLLAAAIKQERASAAAPVQQPAPTAPAPSAQAGAGGHTGGANLSKVCAVLHSGVCACVAVRAQRGVNGHHANVCWRRAD